MVISHKYKLLFIGLPFSASSAIIKDLHEKYEGESCLRKHALYHEFKNIATSEELEYFVFAVLRNPMEIVVTSYEKMKNNAKGNFTNKLLFKENGGHITKKQRKKFNYIQNQKTTFQEYFLKFYKNPYDNFSRMTLENCDFVIRHENIQKDYLLALKKAGIKNPKPLPVVNRTITKNKDLSSYYTNDIKNQAIYVFGPFLKKYNYKFPNSWGNVNISKKSILHFKILGVLRKMNQKLKRRIKRKSIEGTIYGDMQRKKTN